MVVSPCLNVQFSKFKKCEIANCFNFMTVELLESRLEKEPYLLANKAKGKIEFKNIYEGAYKLQSNLRRYDFSQNIFLYNVESSKT